MPVLRLAFDKTARHVDADGRLHIDRSHISKATVNPYYGREIPGFEDLGLAADQVYQLLRDPLELERGAETFARLPILSEHVPVTVDEPRKDLIVGAIGSEVVFNSPYLDADLCIWDASAIAGIETDKVRELSCAYRYVAVMESGTFQGAQYDGRMTQIQGNHLALVEIGRAGPDVVVADHNPFKKESAIMKMSKLGKALFAALCAASPVLAADSALPALVGQASRKTFKSAEIKVKLLALDAELDPAQLNNVMDSILDVEQDPAPKVTPAAAADESPADKARAMLAGKVDDAIIEQICALMAAPAEDAEVLGIAKPNDPDKTKEGQINMTKAMDALSVKLRKEMREAEEARRDVRGVVGDVVIGMDSAAEVYKFALDHLKIDSKDVEGVPALRALFKVASVKSGVPALVIAADGATLDARFPGASRFGTA